MEPILIDIPEEIVTDRLRIRAPRPDDDAAEMNRATVESYAELKPWMPWAKNVPTMEETAMYCRRSLARQVLRESVDFRLHLQDGRFAGTVGFPRLNWKVPSFEIGYWLRTSLAGRGLMTEAVRALTAFAFDKLSAQRVTIQMDERNRASRRVAEKAGFALEGILRNDERDNDGGLRNTCIYALIAKPAGLRT
jgi:RimJ/RimL family protein N-acetyltransferase